MNIWHKSAPKQIPLIGLKIPKWSKGNKNYEYVLVDISSKDSILSVHQIDDWWTSQASWSPLWSETFPVFCQILNFHCLSEPAFLLLHYEHSHLARTVRSSWRVALVGSSRRTPSRSRLHHPALNAPTYHLGQCERSAKYHMSYRVWSKVDVLRPPKECPYIKLTLIYLHLLYLPALYFPVFPSIYLTI